MIILYEQEDGKIAIIHPAEGKSFEDVQEDIPEGARYKVSSLELLPNDQDLKEFSDAMRIDFDIESEYIFFDIEVAREITKNRLRKERIPFFESNDIALRDALLDDDLDKKQAAILERNRLRDLPLLADQLNDLESLRNLHP